MRFSIIVVCLNPGDKLKLTLDSIFAQTCEDYEVIIKDGGSSDGSVDAWRQSEASPEQSALSQEQKVGACRVRFFQEMDSGIYEAMNQAVAHAKGDFVLFLNCGDTFYHEQVLAEASHFLDKLKLSREETERLVFYGDTYSSRSQALMASPRKITPLACYRNIPCHQSCFYARKLCLGKPYETRYAIRADYEHFLWCYFEAKAEMRYMACTVSCYEGGGFSENPANRKKDEREHEEIVKKYLTGGQLALCNLWKYGTLLPLRKKLSESDKFTRLYHRLVSKAAGRK